MDPCISLRSEEIINQYARKLFSEHILPITGSYLVKTERYKLVYNTLREDEPIPPNFRHVEFIPENDSKNVAFFNSERDASNFILSNKNARRDFGGDFYSNDEFDSKQRPILQTRYFILSEFDIFIHNDAIYLKRQSEYDERISVLFTDE